MKSITIILFLCLACVSVANAQSVFGKYEQTALVAPDKYKDSEQDLSITKDEKSSKKIWVSNLIPNQKFYAIVSVKSDDKVIYSVPKQLVGDYQISLGCITFEDDDLTISLNNKQNCFGMSQSDYDTPVKVGSGGVSGGGTNVGRNGTVKGGGVDINKKGDIKVDTKAIMAGVQYVGRKAGAKKKNDDE